jgi:putative transposase
MQPQNKYQHFHRCNLPHLQPTDRTLFVTFNLRLSMPVAYNDYLKLKETELYASFKNKSKTAEDEIIFAKKLFAIQDSYMDRFQSKENVLESPHCAKLMADELHYQNNKLYNLQGFTIMPNHVHLLIEPLTNEEGEYYSVATIMNLIKGRSARFINKELKRSGTLWLREYYDHYVRDENELNNIVRYIVMNPVKAGFVEKAEQWDWTWVSEEYACFVQET